MRRDNYKSGKSEKELNKIKEENRDIATMSDRERYNYFKTLQKKRKQSLKLMKMLMMDKNKSIMTAPPEETDNLLKELREVENEIRSTKQNKNNSAYYEWHPSTGLNRQQRRRK